MCTVQLPCKYSPLPFGVGLPRKRKLLLHLPHLVVSYMTAVFRILISCNDSSEIYPRTQPNYRTITRNKVSLSFVIHERDSPAKNSYRPIVVCIVQILSPYNSDLIFSGSITAIINNPYEST